MSLPIDLFPNVMLVISHLREGRTLSRSCHMVGVAVSTVKDYVGKSIELQNMFDDAVLAGMDRQADALANITDDALYGTKDPKMASVISGNLKWLLARRRPDLYGDKVTVEHHVTADQAIIEALKLGRERVVQEALDVEFVDVSPSETTPELPAPVDLSKVFSFG